MNQEGAGKNQQLKQPHDTREGHMSVFSRFPARTLFVRDLPYSCTSQDLKNYFSEELGVYIARALVCDNRQQKPLHFGYVLLPDEEMVPVAVQKLNGCRFRGRDIRLVLYHRICVLWS
jgi:RNA recognition motif-containing protein